jgi:antitoxin component YwqK of YwqJK toxin-antitoxin module
MSGQGIQFYKNGNREYEGIFVNGESHGFGTGWLPNGHKALVGKWEQNNFSSGEIFYDNGRVASSGKYSKEGGWFEGTKFDENGSKKSEGFYKNHEMNGPGKLYYENGNIKYEGSFENGAYCGQGKLYHSNGDQKYTGHFKNGEYNGFGEKFDLCGRFMCRCEWMGGLI